MTMTDERLAFIRAQASKYPSAMAQMALECADELAALRAAESSRRASPTAPDVECDGCRRGLPLKSGRKHWYRTASVANGVVELPCTAASPPEAAPELRWAVERWNAEVANRPLVNVHRRSLDETWRQVIRHFGGDDEALCGPRHDDLLARAALAALPGGNDA